MRPPQPVAGFDQKSCLLDFDQKRTWVCFVAENWPETFPPRAKSRLNFIADPPMSICSNGGHFRLIPKAPDLGDQTAFCLMSSKPAAILREAVIAVIQASWNALQI